jgi:glutathione S-transferase
MILYGHTLSSASYRVRIALGLKRLQFTSVLRDAWYRNWVQLGFDAIERRLIQDAETGRFCHGDAPTMADVCLVPQVFNARRFAVDLGPYPRIVGIDAACRELPEFQDAAPDRQV